MKESQTGLKCDDETNKKAIEKAYKDKNYETVALKVDVTQPRVKTEDVKYFLRMNFIASVGAQIAVSLSRQQNEG